MLVEPGCQTAASLLPSVVSWRSAERRTSRGSSVMDWPALMEKGIHRGTALVTALGSFPSGSSFLGGAPHAARSRQSARRDTPALYGGSAAGCNRTCRTDSWSNCNKCCINATAREGFSGTTTGMPPALGAGMTHQRALFLALALAGCSVGGDDSS